MQIKMNDSGLIGGPSETVIEHNGKELLWNTSAFDKTSFSGEYDVFEQINAYWERLDQREQDELFAVFTEIRATFNEVFDTNQLTYRLIDLIELLYKYHDLNRIRHWMDFHSDIYVPEVVPATFDQHDSPYDRKRTYIREEYRWLIALALALRPMIPVWGEFIHRTQKEAGSQFKEWQASKLLRKSGIMETEAMLRLMEFVELSVPTDKPKDAAVYGGIGETDFPKWVLGLVLVRRLSIGDIRGIDPRATMIAFIHKYINSKVKGHDSNFIGVVKDKKPVDDWQEGENNISKIEGYKIKEQTAAGDIVTLSWYTGNVLRMIRDVEPNITTSLIKPAMAAVKELKHVQIQKCQVTIAKWVMKPSIQPRGVDLLKKDAVIRVMGAALAILWYRGHYELAAMMSGVASPHEIDLLGGSESRMRLTKEPTDKLNELFPFVKRTSGRGKTTRQPNAGVVAIESLTDQFSEHDWRLTLPSEWVEQITGDPRNRRYQVPGDIKHKLAALVISTASRTTTRKQDV